MKKWDCVFAASLLSNEFEQFKSLAEPLQIQANHIIVREEENAAYVYLVESGYVKIFRSTVDGKNFILGLRKPGDLFGVVSVLQNKKRSSSGEAMVKCKLWRMESKTFIKMLVEYPSIAVKIASIYVKYLDEMQMAISKLLSMEVYQRVAWLLCSLSSPDSDLDKKELRINITHQEIANMVGSSRQRATMALGRLQRAGIISLGKHYIEIVDSNNLKRIYSI